MPKASGTYSFSPNSTTIANYRNYQGAISGYLNQVLNRTGDTGQVTFSTVAAPVYPASSGNGTPIRDFEVFGFNDTLQATKPIVIRFDYMAGSSSAGIIMATVGTGTDFAGNITGSVCQALLVNDYATTSGLVRNCYASSGDGSQLVLLMNVQTTNTQVPDSLGALVVERTRDADGTPNANGYMVYTWRAAGDVGTGTLLSQTSTYFGTASRTYDSGRGGAWSPDFNALVPNIGNETSGTFGATQAAYPVYGYAGNLAQGASKALMIGYQNDYPLLRTMTSVTHYGGTMQFFVLGAAATVNVAYQSATGTAGVRNTMTPLFRFE